MKNLDFKKLLIIILGLVILFIPTYIAIASYYQNKPDVKPDAVTTLTIRDPNGKITVVNSKEDGDEYGYISLFTRLIESGTTVSSLPSDMDGGAFMLVTFSTEESNISYKCYFSTNHSSCYYTDASGNKYQIATAQAKEFLASSLSIYLYTTATPPVLTTVNNTTVYPETLEWYYLAAGSTYQKYDEKFESNETVDYDVGNNFNFIFNIEPASCNLKIYREQTLLYDGAYNTIASLDIDRNSTLRFVLTANWPQSEGCEYYGEAVYNFMADVSAPAEFKLGEDTIEHGDIVAITGINVKDPSAVSVTIEPAVDFTPTFYADGDLVYALIPFSYNVEQGEYKITVKYGITETKLSLTVIKARYDMWGDRNYDATSQLIEAQYSEQDVADYNALVSQICGKSETSRFFTGAFLEYRDKDVLTAEGAVISLGFSRITYLINAPGRSFVHDGVDFIVNSGVEVPAVAAGKVAYAGYCDVLGNFVVIDHGYGLKSWYAHLSEISVSSGDVLTASQSVGKTGQTGFTIENRLHFAFTLDNVPVAPFSLWDEGVILAKFD